MSEQPIKGNGMPIAARAVYAEHLRAIADTIEHTDTWSMQLENEVQAVPSDSAWMEHESTGWRTITVRYFEPVAVSSNTRNVSTMTKHRLHAIIKVPLGEDPPKYVAECVCGKDSGLRATQTEAHQWFDEHLTSEWDTTP